MVGNIRINFQAFKSRTNMVEGYLVPHEQAELPADVIEGQMRSPEDKAILILTTACEEKVLLKSLLFVAKK